MDGAQFLLKRTGRDDAAEFGEAWQLAPDATARLLNDAGLYLYELARFAEAKKNYERALRIDEAACGPDRLEVARDVNNLGIVLQYLGELAEARRCFERALRILRHFLSEDHPKTVIVRNNLERLR